MKASVVTFAQLPEEETNFLVYLAKTGEVWARAEVDNPKHSVYKPAPVTEFLEVYASQLAEKNGVVSIYLGFRPDVLKPMISKTEEGSLHIDIFGSNLLGYRRGEYYSSGELAQSNLYFYRGSFYEGEFVSKPDTFLRWAAKVLGWVKRHTPEKVPVYQCNYKTRATVRVAKAAVSGLKVWY